jgi:hypothetical protein
MAWEQLVEALRQGRQDHEDYVSQPPRACPNDGEPLKEGPDGSLFCPSDGWTPERDPNWH